MPAMIDLYGRSRFTLAWGFTASMGSILVLFAAAMYGLSARDHLLAFDAELESKARMMASGIHYGIHRGKRRIKLDDVPVLGSNTLPLDHDIAYARWYDAQGNLVRFVRHPPTHPQVQRLGFETLQIDNEATDSSLRHRQITLPVRQDDTLIGYLQVAAVLTPVQQQLARQRFWLTLGVPCALGTIALAGWWLGGLAMAPLQQAHQRLQRFTSHASHELRTPLAQILSHVQLVLGTDEVATERWRLGRVATIIKTMDQMVSDLLFLARQAGQLSRDQLRSLDLRELIQELAWDCEALAANRGIGLTCELPHQPVWVAANVDLLHQALLNLTDNALKYTPASGKIKLILATQGGWAHMQVINTGTLAPDSLPHLFEQFYRDPLAQSKEGYGLGLAIAQQIAQAHGGDITACSAAENMLCFELALPLTSPLLDFR